jgi:aspartate racemase
MTSDTTTRQTAAWPRILGVVGGLGPHAHVRFEHLLLRETEARAPSSILGDQDYPPYLVASLPQTPDRTTHLLEGGPSPLPWLEQSLLALKGPADGLGADFAVIACNAAHAFLPALRKRSILPLLDIVAETVAEIHRHTESRSIGLLATTGTLQTQLYQRAGNHHGLTAISLLDLPAGEELQRSLVMASIYGVPNLPGIKGGAYRDPRHRPRLLENLRRAIELLRSEGADLVVTACTEISLALSPEDAVGAPLVDPLRIAARVALEIAAGERQVPSNGPVDPERNPS